MIQKETIQFLTDLRKHNDRTWFEKNRQRFEDARSNFSFVVESLIKELGKSDPDVALLVAKNCIFRQNRDVRFSKDKSPYKISMGAYLNRGGKKINTAGYYFHLEPGNSFVAGGLYQPDAIQLAKVRQEIDYNLSEFESILRKPSFKKAFSNGLNKSDILSRPPKGYDHENPAIEYLKLKSFTVSQPISNKDLQDPSLKRALLAAFRSLQPMIQFLNRASE